MYRLTNAVFAGLLGASGWKIGRQSAVISRVTGMSGNNHNVQQMAQANQSGPLSLTTTRRTIASTVAKITETLLPSDLVARMREGRGWKHWISSLEPQLFDNLAEAPIEVKRHLFKQHITLVEIEAQAKCNRICTFCPNVIVDRRKNNILTDAELLDKVFTELGSIDYRQQIKFARYSEPLSNIPYLCERIKSARKLIPNAQLAIVTNTDYLKPGVLDRLREAGLDRIYMSLYLRRKEKWSLELAHAYTEKLAKRLGARILTRSTTPVSLRCTFAYDGIELLSACMNFEEYGTDRGSTIKQYIKQERLGPCREPFETFVIDYTGSVMPCCNLRSDFPQHQDFIVGDPSQPGTSIFDIYAGQLAAWRRSMIGFDSKGYPCATCRHRDVPDNLVAQIAAHTEKHLYKIGRKDLYKPPTGR